MGVKLLALLVFSPLFLAKACIDAVSSLNQYLLDYLPGGCALPIHQLSIYFICSSSSSFHQPTNQPTTRKHRHRRRRLLPRGAPRLQNLLPPRPPHLHRHPHPRRPPRAGRRALVVGAGRPPRRCCPVLALGRDLRRPRMGLVRWLGWVDWFVCVLF